jgi:hypothetical protein
MKHRNCDMNGTPEGDPSIARYDLDYDARWRR